MSIAIPIQMYDEFKRVLTVMGSVKHFAQYPPAQRYSRLFFAKWKPYIDRNPSLFIDLHTQVLLQGKTTLRNIRKEQEAAV